MATATQKKEKDSIRINFKLKGKAKINLDRYAEERGLSATSTALAIVLERITPESK